MSQPDLIVLSVDELDNNTFVTHPYTNYDRTSVRSTYIGADHTSLDRNVMALFRSPAKPVGNFPGVEKTSIKFTDDKSVSGNDGVSTLRIPAIAELAFSLPIGMTDAEKLLLRQKCIAALDHAFTLSFQSQLVI